MVFINHSDVNNSNVHDCCNSAADLIVVTDITDYIHGEKTKKVIMKRKPDGHHKAMIDVHKSKTEQVMQPKHQSRE